MFVWRNWCVCVAQLMCLCGAIGVFVRRNWCVCVAQLMCLCGAVGVFVRRSQSEGFVWWRLVEGPVWRNKGVCAP